MYYRLLYIYMSVLGFILSVTHFSLFYKKLIIAKFEKVS